MANIYLYLLNDQNMENMLWIGSNLWYGAISRRERNNHRRWMYLSTVSEC
jgi:hypothetical protein